MLNLMKPLRQHTVCWELPQSSSQAQLVLTTLFAALSCMCHSTHHFSGRPDCCCSCMQTYITCAVLSGGRYIPAVPITVDTWTNASGVLAGQQQQQLTCGTAFIPNTAGSNTGPAHATAFMKLSATGCAVTVLHQMGKKVTRVSYVCTSAAPWFTYPEVTPSSTYYIQAVASRPSLGISISGGGFRAATLALGFIRWVGGIRCRW